MARNRREEDIELLKLVGAALENAPIHDRAGGRLARLRLRAKRVSRRFTRHLSRRRLARLLKKHRMVLACILLSVVPLYALVVASSSPAQKEAPALSLDGPPTTRPGPGVPGGTAAPSATKPVSEETNPLAYWFGRVEDEDWRIRTEAAYQLLKMSRESMVVSVSLVEILEDPHAGPRFWTAHGLRRRGLHSNKVEATVRGFSGNDEILHAYRASSAEMRGEFERIIGRWLRDKDDLYRWTALTICGMLGWRAEVFRPQLELIAEVDPRPLFREQADLVLRAL